MAVISLTDISPSQDCFCSSDNRGIFKNRFHLFYLHLKRLTHTACGKSVFVNLCFSLKSLFLCSEYTFEFTSLFNNRQTEITFSLTLLTNSRY